MIRNLSIPRNVFQARRGIRKNRRHQVVGQHASRLKHRRIQKRLHEDVARRRRVQIAKDIGERKRMLRAERQQQTVLGRRRLQLEIELSAEPLAQRQAPGSVDAAAKRCVQHELHAAGLVEESFEHQRLLRGQHAERGPSFVQIRDGLLRRLGRDAAFVAEPRVDRGSAEMRLHVATQVAHGTRQLVASCRRLAEPERQRRGRALRVDDAHDARANLCDLPRRVAELNDVAGRTLDGEVFVQRADERVFRIEDDAVVGHFRNGAARRNRETAGAAPAAQAAVDLVAMQQRAAPAAFGREPFRRHPHDGVELAARQRSIGPRALRQGKEIVLGVVLARGFGNDLLRQHVERGVVRHNRVQLAAPHRSQERRALDEIVPRYREKPSLGDAGHRMAGAPGALQERRNPVWRADLAHEIHVPDVDAELE
jgi:hypothetical protein